MEEFSMSYNTASSIWAWQKDPNTILLPRACPLPVFRNFNNYLRFSAGETHDLILEHVTGDRMSCPCLHHITQYSILAVWSAILLIVLLNKASSRTEEASDKKLREGSSQEPIRSLGPS